MTDPESLRMFFSVTAQVAVALLVFVGIVWHGILGDTFRVLARIRGGTGLERQARDGWKTRVFFLPGIIITLLSIVAFNGVVLLYIMAVGSEPFSWAVDIQLIALLATIFPIAMWLMQSMKWLAWWRPVADTMEES